MVVAEDLPPLPAPDASPYQRAHFLGVRPQQLDGWPRSSTSTRLECMFQYMRSRLIHMAASGPRTPCQVGLTSSHLRSSSFHAPWSLDNWSLPSQTAEQYDKYDERLEEDGRAIAAARAVSEGLHDGDEGAEIVDDSLIYFTDFDDSDLC